MNPIDRNSLTCVFFTILRESKAAVLRYGMGVAPAAFHKVSKTKAEIERVLFITFCHLGVVELRAVELVGLRIDEVAVWARDRGASELGCSVPV
jgi:hypothetical protein